MRPRPSRVWDTDYESQRKRTKGTARLGSRCPFSPTYFECNDGIVASCWRLRQSTSFWLAGRPPLGIKSDNIRGATNYGAQSTRERFQRIPLFVQVVMPIVRAGHAGNGVAENPFGDVRPDISAHHQRSACAPNIVQYPIRNAACSVEMRLGLGKSGERSGPSRREE